MYHDDLSKEEARRGEAAMLAGQFVTAKVASGLTRNVTLDILTRTAARIDRFLEGKLITEVPSALLFTGIDEEKVTEFAQKWLAEHGKS